MSVWISDIQKYYSETVRILKPGGRFIVNDYHPVRRMWLDTDEYKPHHSYFNRGPYEYRSDEGLPTFEYHWTVSDHIQAVLDAGCHLVKVDEHGEKIDEFWMKVNLDKLPAYLLIVGEKNSSDVGPKTPFPSIYIIEHTGSQLRETGYLWSLCCLTSSPESYNQSTWSHMHSETCAYLC